MKNQIATITNHYAASEWPKVVVEGMETEAQNKGAAILSSTQEHGQES